MNVETGDSFGMTIRDLASLEEVRAAEALQKEVWGFSDLDVVPLSQLVAAKAAGGTLVGAFDRKRLVGFAYSFVGYEKGHTTHHSHMLAVLPSYRHRNLGYRLKLAQRDRALEQRITRMTWTFDPLQSLNAHFNFGKLGVFADEYKLDFYGEHSTSFAHRHGTDRLWVTWLLTSRRVEARLAGERPPAINLAEIMPLVQLSPDMTPRERDPAEALARDRVLIEVPRDINALNDDQLVRRWRMATRRAFTAALAAGYLVEEFCRNDHGSGFYVLSRGRRLEDFS